MNYKLNFSTSYSQFSISNKSEYVPLQSTIGILNEDEYGYASKEWFDEAIDNYMGIKDNEITIFMKSYWRFRGVLSVLKKPNNEIDYSKYDHVVEGGIDLRSGILQILECPSSQVQFEIKLPTRKYRVRVYISDLNTEKDNNDNAREYYKIEIWPDSEMGVKVLKRAKRDN